MPAELRVLRTADEIRQWRKSVGPASVGFVPTMGALHAGHGELLRQVRPRCDFSVLSIFVNPTQFGPKEDLSKYPRTFEQDLAIAREHGVDVVFAPTPEVMYGPMFSTFVEETRLSLPLCGVFRPGHFRGVTTVVLKLFNLVRPDLALFGLKDAQQFFVIKKMVEDLNLDVTVEGIPTVREPDGLALSSRNRYLTLEDRERAPEIYRALQMATSKLRQGADLNGALAEQKDRLIQLGFDVQYLECLELPDLVAVKSARISPNRSYLLAIAAFLSGTRLIDNLIFDFSI